MAVQPTSAALHEGDLLLAVDRGRNRVDPMLQEAIRGHAARDETAFRVQRGSEELRHVRVVRQ